MPRVNPEILKWARETAGLSLDEASRKLDLRATKALAPPARLRALEAGEVQPSRPLLAKMAKHYHRPLLVFYLAEPPRKADRGQDFRTLPADRELTDEAILDALLRDVRARQSTIRNVMEEEDEAVAVPFVGSAAVAGGLDPLIATLREWLQFDLMAFRAAPNADTAFAELRNAAETAGVFVLLIGDLGSHHTKLSVETFRGIALSDPVAPIVVINDHDARSAWSFTLIHELAHLCLGQTGISGAWSELAVEKLCNDAASELLLPRDEVESIELPSEFELTSYQRCIGEFARPRNVSSSMVAYRLLRHEKISHAEWRDLQTRFHELWLQAERDRRAKNRASEAGPDYYVVRRHRLGTHLVEFVARMLRAGALTTTKAARLLGVKPSSVYSLVEANTFRFIRELDFSTAWRA